MLAEVVLYRNLRRLKVWRRLYLLDLQLCIMDFDFLRSQIFWNNLPVPLLALLYILCFQIQGLEIQWRNIFNDVPQTWFIDVCKIVILFFNIVLYFYDKITRNEMSLTNAWWMQFYPLPNALIIGFKRPIFIVDVCQYKNPTWYSIQTFHRQFLSSISHFVCSLWCWEHGCQH